jgi:hypothetical protein
LNIVKDDKLKLLSKGKKLILSTQCCGFGYGSWVMMTKKKKIKNTAENSKIAIYFILGLHKGCPSYRKSLRPLKENIQDFNCFLFFWAIFARVADPGCLSRIVIFTHPGSRISDPGSKNSN